MSKAYNQNQWRLEKRKMLENFTQKSQAQHNAMQWISEILNIQNRRENYEGNHRMRMPLLEGYDLVGVSLWELSHELIYNNTL